jgi:Fe-S-cluster containining protein
MRPERDTELVQIVDNALADATRRALKPDGTSWLSCRPGCTPCCHGVFHISALDAERLRAGLRELQQHDPDRAAMLLERARGLRDVLAPHFPGNATTGELSLLDDTAWDTFADLPEADAACPALDPATGRCELYAYRPLTCRVFGPPVLNETGIGLCELCYIGTSEAEILHGEMHLQHAALEAELDETLPQNSTVIAWALLP